MTDGLPMAATRDSGLDLDLDLFLEPLANRLKVVEKHRICLPVEMETLSLPFKWPRGITLNDRSTM